MATCLLAALSISFVRPSALSFGQGKCALSRGRCLVLSATVTPAEAGHSIAQWCVAAGREEATVAVSSSTTLAGALADFWSTARSLATEEGRAGRQRALAFPFLSTMANAQAFQEMLQHIDECTELCEYLGQSMLVAGRHPTSSPKDDEPQAAPYPMVLLRSFTQVAPGDYAAENYGEADPFADNLVHEGETIADEGLFETVTTAASADEAKANACAWCESVAARIFTLNPAADGDILYSATPANTGESAYEHFWRQVARLAATDAAQCASVMMVAPCFAPHNAGAFEAFAGTLVGALESLSVGDEVQLAFFHPEIVLDEVENKEIAKGVDFARRSPHPMVSVLRTPQVEQYRERRSTAPERTKAFIEIHERLCGPEGGLIPP